MRLIRWLTPLLLFFVIVFILSACGESLKKPTGLEDPDAELQENVENNEEDTGNDYENENVNEHAVNSTKKSDTKSEDDENNKSTHTTESEEVASDKQSESSTKKSSNKNHQKEKSSDDKSSKRNVKSKSNKADDQGNPREKSKKESKENPKKDTKEDARKDPNNNREDKQKEEPKQDSGKENQNPEPKNTITHSIVISSDEVPLPETKQEIENGDTALAALIAITMAKGIHMDYRGGQGASAYVQGMGNVYEFDRGQGSGWMFRVNGIFPNRGVGVIPLCDGDDVEWLYTTDLGQDLDADLQPFREDGKCP